MSTIWKKEFEIKELDEFSKNCMVEHVGIKFLEKGNDFISATMPVDKTTKQPMGILHGGASVVLAETLGSIASNMALADPYYSVGLEIKANHLKSVGEGLVKGVVKPVHLGRTTHVWDISIENENKELTCVSRITMAVLNRNERISATSKNKT